MHKVGSIQKQRRLPCFPGYSPTASWNSRWRHLTEVPPHRRFPQQSGNNMESQGREKPNMVSPLVLLRSKSSREAHWVPYLNSPQSIYNCPLLFPFVSLWVCHLAFSTSCNLAEPGQFTVPSIQNSAGPEYGLQEYLLDE